MIKIGTEIELEYNTRRVNINVGDYHRGADFGCAGWDAQSDGSLNTDRWLEIGNTAEIVSKPIVLHLFSARLANFIDFFSCSGEYELKDVINFNNSTGSHVHLSYGNRKFWSRVPFGAFYKTRMMFFHLLENSNIKSRNQIKSRYFRDYAKRLTPSRYANKSERRYEFNFKCETETDDNGRVCSRGIEWRSLNLTGISTWDELREFYTIVTTCIKYLVDIAWEYQITKTVEIQDIDIQPKEDSVWIDGKGFKGRTRVSLNLNSMSILSISRGMDVHIDNVDSSDITVTR